jgi:multidrug efflux pump subunit AcrB
MTNLAQFVVNRPIYGWILALVCLFGGIHGIDNIGRLEDPDFPVKHAYIITTYPGASAEEVEQEVTDTIEDALQELPSILRLKSKSVPGRSEIQVELLEEFGESDTPQAYDEMRRRVSEAQMRLPPGVDTPLVEDDFGDIYGILYAVKAPGYSDAELHDIAKEFSTQLKLVPNVAKVSTSGLPFEAIYIEIDEDRLTRLGLSIDDIAGKIHLENQVVGAGSTLFDGRRLRIAQPSSLGSVDELKEMKIGTPGSTEMIRLGDVTNITRNSLEAPFDIVRLNGEPVFTFSVSVTPGQNVVAVGEDIDRKVLQIAEQLPIGISIEPIYKQHTAVKQAITNFLKNLGISVLTVIIALNLFMGWRAGTVVGVVLFLTVMGTIEIMWILGVELQRISLGALMLAMGMLVDNGIVIAEGMVVGVRRGLTPKNAAIKSVARTQYALLGATIIGILAFAPISLSDDNSGHFLVSLFQVVAISLMLSWLLAITIVPLLGNILLTSMSPVADDELYQTWYFKAYKKLISFGLRRAWLSAVIIIAITSACLFSMKFVKTSFFPTNNTPLFFVDYRLPEGTDIITTSRDLEEMESEILTVEGVTKTVSFIGRGSPRFTSMTQPEQPNPAYARLIIESENVKNLNEQMNAVKTLFADNRPDAEVMITRAEFSPGSSSKIEMRYSGPDITVLRQLAEQTLAIYMANNLIDRKTDWRAQSLQLAPQFNEANARLAGISRNDLAKSLAYNTHGIQIGLIRDDDKLVPIIARAPDAERTDLRGLQDRQVWSATQRKFIPITQVVSEFRLEPENTTIFRRNQIRTITVQANPPEGHNVNSFFQAVKEDVEALTLPSGYAREWGGEFENDKMANESLGERMPMAFALMFFITVLMFGALKQPIVIWLTVPMTLCGVAIGLLVTDLPLTFPSMLGILSLSGMLIKNCIVLVDEIDKRLEEDAPTLETMVLASLSRLRPVMLAALTTIFGMSPLLTDAFFREMAVCVMSGLMFATLLTLIAVPVFYRIALGSRIRPA